MKKLRGLFLLVVFVLCLNGLVSRIDNSISGAAVKVTKKTIYMNKGSRKKVTAVKGKWRSSSTSKVTLRKSKDGSNYKTLSNRKSAYIYAKGLCQNSGKKVTVTGKNEKYQYTIYVGEKPVLSHSNITMNVNETVTVRVKNWSKLIKPKKKESRWTYSGYDVIHPTVGDDSSAIKITGLEAGNGKVVFKYMGNSYTVNVKVIGNAAATTEANSGKDSSNGTTESGGPGGSGTEATTEVDVPELEWNMAECCLEFTYTHWGNQTGCGWCSRKNECSTIVNESIKELAVKIKDGDLYSITKDNLSKLNFTSSDESVAIVEKITVGNYTEEKYRANIGICATVKAKKPGKTTITCTTPKNSFSIEITVIENIKDLRAKEINNFITALPAGATDYDKMVALQKYVNENYTYNSTQRQWNLADNGGTSGYEYMYYGGDCNIYYTKEGTCTSFGALVSDFCYSMGIECYTVWYSYGNGMYHMENYVLADGKYYLFDASRTPNTTFQQVSSLPSSAEKVTGLYVGDSYVGG